MLSLLLAAAALPLLSACDPIVNGQDDTEPRTYAATSDRLSQDDMEKMVDGPMDKVFGSGLSVGEAEFQRLVEQAQGSGRDGPLKAADLQTAFGLELYREALDNEDGALAGAAIEHLRAAVPAYERALGRRHVEVALALTTLADAKAQLAAGWQQDRIGMYREALSIRVEKLGSRNPETVASMVDVGQALVEDPAAGRAAKEEALALYNEAKVSAPYGLAIDDELAWPKLELGRAEVLASLGRSAESIEIAEHSIDALEGDENCEAVKYFAGRVAERLAGSDRKAADRLTNKVGQRCED